MVRVIACNSKAVSFSGICICPEKVYKPKFNILLYLATEPLTFNIIQQFLLIVHNLYQFFVFFLFFLLAVRVGLTNYTSRANIYFDCPPRLLYHLRYLPWRSRLDSNQHLPWSQSTYIFPTTILHFVEITRL